MVIPLHYTWPPLLNLSSSWRSSFKFFSPFIIILIAFAGPITSLPADDCKFRRAIFSFNSNMNILREFTVGGVNFSIEGNGGPNCVQYLPVWQRLIETVFFVPICIYAIGYSLGNLETPFWFHQPRKQSKRPNSGYRSRHGSVDSLALWDGSTESSLISSVNASQCYNEVHLDESTFRYSVIAIYSVVFGAELAFKVISRTAIFLLNPCHITTMLQLALLTMKSNRRITCLIFRFHMYTIPGAILAIIFPILNTRLLPGEVFIYYVQHFLIILIPIYMIYLEGAFIPESSTNTGWPILCLSIIILYHFTILQFVGLYTQVNLNCIICPAVSDPFKGSFYRIIAIAHQSVFIPFTTKLYNCIAPLIAACFRSYRLFEAFRSYSGIAVLDEHSRFDIKKV